MTPSESMGGRSTALSFAVLCLLLGSCKTHAGESDAAMKENDVTPWYEAFDRNDPGLLDAILSKDWQDIPAAPGQPAGPAGAKHILTELATAFPGLRIAVKDTIREGDKVVARSEITATQRGPFLGRPATNRTMTIQAIDIHEFRDGRIVRTWHTEDWMTGLRQLGVFDK
jgi:steroid delta-isomerase-like uncharacterized protein